MAKDKDESVDMASLPFQVHFDPDSFDSLISAHGLRFQHWRATRCPMGLTSIHDVRRSGECNLGCSNGFLYTYAGKVICVASGNNAKLTQYDPGLLNGSSLHITPTRYYLDCEGATPRLVQLLQFDRLYFDDEAVTVPMWELVQAHEMGIDRLRFPAIQVIDLIDNKGIRYSLGDFQVIGGQIKWGSKAPGIDPDSGKGRVYSVRYLYRPYYYLKDLMHELRFATTDDDVTGPGMLRMSQSAIIQREYLFENTERNSSALDPGDPRQTPGPADGGFSAR